MLKKCALFFIVFIFTMALGAEWISNSAPLVAKINDHWIFPAYKHYNRPHVGLSGAGTVPYKELTYQFALWPLLPWDAYENDPNLPVFLSPPSARHPLGTDTGGRDVFARLLYGTRISFAFALSVWVITFIMGSALGLLQGYLGGVFDLLCQRFIEVFASTPELYVLLFLITLFSPHLWLLVTFTSLFGWVGISRYMRAEALRARGQTYCLAARTMGASTVGILWRHILPNSLVPVFTLSPFAIIAGILGLAQLDFLGFGVPPPTPSWGEMLQQAKDNFQVAWWLTAFPCSFIALTVLSFNVLGESYQKRM